MTVRSAANRWRSRFRKAGLAEALGFAVGAILLAAISVVQDLVSGEAHSLDSHVISVLLGGAAGVIAAFVRRRDLAHRTTAEQALISSEERFRGAFENANVGMSLVRPDGRFFMVNRAYCQMIGLPESELVTKTVADITHPDDREDNDALNRRLWAGGMEGDSFATEKRYLRGDGEVVWGSVTVSLVRDADGRPLYSIGQAIDVTQRRRAEQALRDSERRYRQLVELAPDPIYIDHEGRFALVNPSAARMLGADGADALLGQSVLDRVHPDFSGAVSEGARRIVEQGRPVRAAVMKFVGLDGRVSDVEVTAGPVAWGSGTAIIVLARDISRRMEAERALRESQERLEAIADNSPAAIYLKDREGRYLFVNRRFEILYELDADAAVGRTLREIIGEEIAAGSEAQDREVLERGATITREITDHREGTVLTLMVTKFPVPGPDGTPIGLGGVDTDITDRKRVEEALRQGEERFRIIAETSPVAIVISRTADAGILYCNGRAGELLGRPVIELVGRSVADFFDDPAQHQALISGLESGPPVRNEAVRCHCADGSWRWALVSMHALKFQGEDAVVVAAMDVTEMRQTQAQLIQASKMATLGEMATGIAHELNQPLNIIRMSADSMLDLMDDKDLPPKTLTNKLALISGQTERAAAIIDHMRVLGRRSPESVEAFDPREAVESALGLVSAQFEARNIELVVDLPETCRWVSGWPVQLEQVLLNLLGNARDAIEYGNHGRRRNAHPMRITVGLRDNGQGDHVGLVVEDSGGGIREDILDRIFEPFFTTKDVGKGTGLGLSISYGIMRDMGGGIEAANVDGGARFTVTLPVAD